MTRINDDLVVQYIEGEHPTDDRIVFAHSNGSEFILTFTEIARVRASLTYFDGCHDAAVDAARVKS